MVILRNTILTMVLLLFSGAVWCGEYVNPNASSARAKENEWIVIERYSDVEVKNDPEYYGQKKLNVDVRFRKQCEARKVGEEERHFDGATKIFIETLGDYFEYDCDYHTRIHVSWFGPDGKELRMESKFPAKIRFGKSPRPPLVALPDDMADQTFKVPKGAEKWDVWVSK